MGCREPHGTKELGMTTEGELREQLVRFVRQMITTGLVRGTSGNISTREPGAAQALVTPSGVDYDTMTPDAVVLVDLVCRLLLEKKNVRRSRDGGALHLDRLLLRRARGRLLVAEGRK